MKYFFRAVILLIAFISTNNLYSQDLAVKSNILYDATGSMNLGVELGLSKHLSLDVSGTYNPWTINKATNSKAKFMMIQPELRFWNCERFSGHFFGLHAHYAYYNVGGDNWLTKMAGLAGSKDMKKYRYDGWLAGAGFSYGYHWLLSNRWALEGTIGFGYASINYKEYDCEGCGQYKSAGTKHYFGPTKLGLSLIFMIK